MSGGVGQDGLLIKSKNQYIESPGSSETVRLFIDKDDGKAYLKNKNGSLSPFVAGSDNSGYETLKKFNITIDGQVDFVLDTLINPITRPLLLVNGQSQEYGLDYTVTGLNLKWLNKDFTLETTDTLEIYY